MLALGCQTNACRIETIAWRLWSRLRLIAVRTLHATDVELKYYVSGGHLVAERRSTEPPLTIVLLSNFEEEFLSALIG
jgi:hypothetical protein